MVGPHSVFFSSCARNSGLMTQKLFIDIISNEKLKLPVGIATLFSYDFTFVSFCTGSLCLFTLFVSLSSIKLLHQFLF